MITRNKIKKYLSQTNIVIKKLDKLDRSHKPPVIDQLICEITIPVCFICKCSNADAWLNCKRGGISLKNRPKYKDSNNPVCIKCCTRIFESKQGCCPLCRSKNWFNFLDIRYPQKKKSFIERQKIRAKKKDEKDKRKKQRLKFFFSDWDVPLHLHQRIYNLYTR